MKQTFNDLQRIFFKRENFLTKKLSAQFFLNSKFTYSMIQGTFSVKGSFGGEKKCFGPGVNHNAGLPFPSNSPPKKMAGFLGF